MTRQGFTIHHNGPPAGVVGRDHDRCQSFWDGVRNYHTQKKGWSDIAYSFGVCPHGLLFTGRGWDKSQWANGSDAVGVNDGSDSEWYTVLAFVGGGEYGGFDTGDPEEVVTTEMLAGLRLLIQEGRTSGRCDDRVLPHNAFKKKACPARTLTDRAYLWDNAPLDSGDDMNDAELRAALDDQNKWVKQTINGYHAETRKQILAAIDPAAQAKAISTELSGVGTSTVTDEQLERVWRKILGSLDGSP